MLLLAVLASASAWLVTRKAPQHRPLAWALTVCAGLDAVRLLGLPARVDMALWLVTPGISAAVYRKILGCTSNLTPYLVMVTIAWTCAGVAALPPMPELWTAYPLIVYTLLVISGLIDVIHRAVFGGWSISQRVALILLAGDALAVASLCAREWISNQAGVVLAAVTVYQVMWWWRWNREPTS